MPRLFHNTLLPPGTDFHTHLRMGSIMSTVTPLIISGGISTVYVMPNLNPPITSVAMASQYRSELLALAPDVRFLMTLYLCDEITPEVIRAAARTTARSVDGKEEKVVYGVKSYPAGVTTGSDRGVVDYERYYPVFEAMQDEGLVLNLHGEVPSTSPPTTTHANRHDDDDDGDAIDVLNAEAKFLPTLLTLNRRFPRLKIVLEHCTTAAAIAAVKRCSETVAATITAHHLFLTVDDWAGDPLHFCKPVAKRESDRRALLRAIVDVESRGRFFLGTDSAPHPLKKKFGGGIPAGGGGNDNAVVVPGKCAAGVFTQGWSMQFVLEALEEAVRDGVVRKEAVTQEILEGFLGGWGRIFYGLEEDVGSGMGKRIRIFEGEERVPETLEISNERRGVEDLIVPFRRGEKVYSLEWVDAKD